MSTVDLNSGPNAPGVISGKGKSSLEAHKIRVAKFVGHMQGKSVISSTFEKSLETHLAAFASPQGTASESGSQASGNAEHVSSKEPLVKLAQDIRAGESKISIGTKLLAWLISMFGGEDYGTAMAKEAFLKLDEETKRTLLGLAFQAAALPESLANVKDNVQTLLKFCQAAGIKEDAIIGAVNTIPDSDGKVRVLEKLGSNFRWDNISPGVAKDLAQKLANAGPNGTYYLAKLLVDSHLNLIDMPKFTGDAAKDLALGLAAAGEEGAKCLQQLIANNDLDLSSMPKFTGDAAKSLGQSLAAAGEEGLECLQQLITKDKLTNLCFLDANATKDLAQKLANAGPNGSYYLAKLLVDSHLNPTDMPKFTGDAAKDLSLSLAKVSSGEKYLQQLIANDKLDLASMPNFQDSEAKRLVQDLAIAGEKGLECLQQLISKLPDFQSTTARQVVKSLIDVRSLLDVEADVTKYLVELFKNDKLTNLRLLGISSQDDIKTTVLPLLEQERYGLDEFKNFLYPI